MMGNLTYTNEYIVQFRVNNRRTLRFMVDVVIGHPQSYHNTTCKHIIVVASYINLLPSLTLHYRLPTQRAIGEL
jgi:hypothetical protein